MYETTLVLVQKYVLQTAPENELSYLWTYFEKFMMYRDSKEKIWQNFEHTSKR